MWTSVMDVSLSSGWLSYTKPPYIDFPYTLICAGKGLSLIA